MLLHIHAGTVYNACTCTCFMLLWRFQRIQLIIIIPRYTADTVGRCDNLVYYLVMHTHMKPDSTVDTL